MSCNSVAPCLNLVYLLGDIEVFYSFIFYYYFFNLVNSFLVSVLRGMAAQLSCFSSHLSIFSNQISLRDPVFTNHIFTALLVRCTLQLLLGVAVKKQIFSISQITDIEQYIAFVFTHATETSKILKIKKKLNLVELFILVQRILPF